MKPKKGGLTHCYASKHNTRLLKNNVFPSNVYSSTYRSSCMGLTYPAAKMFRDRILGSMMVSSDSGVLRRRPEKAQVPKLEQFIHKAISLFVQCCCCCFFRARKPENQTYPQQALGYLSILCRLLTRVQW